jgi:hypothetical protein
MPTGSALKPVAIWLDTGGELFLEGSSWIYTVRQGHEADGPTLLAAQDAAIAERFSLQARTLLRKPDHPVLIRGARVFDAVRGRVLPPTNVLVRGERIAAVGRFAIPADAEIIDGKGKTLIPGLVDMHQHVLNDTDGLIDIMNGVTTIRDLGRPAATPS